jgi:hypothetical protein
VFDFAFGYNSFGDTVGKEAPMEPEDETAGLRHRLMRLRMALRFSNDPRTEAILREVISNIEERLIAVESAGIKAPERKTGDAPKKSTDPVT